MPASAKRSVYLIETYWAAAVAVVDEPAAMDGSPIMESLLQRIEHKTRVCGP
jgi:hypothetical protein